jgi:hypothetical protein
VFTEHTFAFPVVDTSLYIAFRYFINCTNAGFYVHVDDVSVDVVTGVGPGDDPIPEVLALMPNFPNPFNPSTTLRFTVPQRADLVLTVYDLLGREVAKPAAGTFGPGTYSVVWDARGMASGAYVARLTGGGASATRMMVLAR